MVEYKEYLHKYTNYEDYLSDRMSSDYSEPFVAIIKENENDKAIMGFNKKNYHLNEIRNRSNSYVLKPIENINELWITLFDYEENNN